MESEVVASLAGAAVGAMIGFALTELKDRFVQKRKLRGYVNLLSGELVWCKAALKGLSPDRECPRLPNEIWKSIRFELAPLLDVPRLRTLFVLAAAIEEWNQNIAGKELNQSGLEFVRDRFARRLLVQLSDTIEELERLAVPFWYRYLLRLAEAAKRSRSDSPTGLTTNRHDN